MSGKRVPKTINECGSALLAALAILATLAVTISGVLFFGSWHRAQGVIYLEDVRVRSLAESGIHHAMAELASDPLHRLRQHSVVLDSANQITYTIRPWGAYLRIQSTGTGRRLTRTLTADIGMHPPDIFDHVLSPIGPPLPLVVSGNTFIQGNVYVSSGGITTGEINGQGFRGARLVDGTIDTLNPRHLPKFDDAILVEFLDSLDATKNEIPESDYSLIYRDNGELAVLPVDETLGVRTRANIEFDMPDSIEIESTHYFFAEHTIRVLGKTHLRNVVLASKEVIVAHQSHLENCVIVANHAQLIDGSTFSGQVIATDTVRIEDNANLGNPTLILLRGRRLDDQIVGEVEISSSGSLWATVVHGVNSAANSKIPHTVAACRLHVSDDSNLRGLLWSEGFVDIEGTFHGAAAVNLFSHYVQPTTYMNWLVDTDLRYLDVASSAAFPVVLESRTRPRLSKVIGSISR